MKSMLLKDLCWGNSVALAWTWGYGTYLSIQIALSFGLCGLLIFLIPNAIGLALFGVIAHRLSNRLISKKIDFVSYFLAKTTKYRSILILFQLYALSINVFGFIRYVAIPLGYSLTLTVLLLLTIPVFLVGYGRTSNIRWIHLLLGIILFLSIFYLGCQINTATINQSLHTIVMGLTHVSTVYFIGWSVITTVGLLFAPWLDMQHWQRAAQIQQPQGNLSRSYIIGGILFFIIIFFHGCAALYLKLQGLHFVAEPIIGEIVSYRYSVITYLADFKQVAGMVYLLFLFSIAIGGINLPLMSRPKLSQN